MKRYKHLDALTASFVAVLLVSNLVAQKICQLGPFTVSAAVLLFPATYIFGDIFTEVYGYAVARRVIWIGFFATGLLAALGMAAVWLPPAPEWREQKQFAEVFRFVPRFLGASLAAYWMGEFANSYTLAKLKILTRGRWLWTRTIGSTVVGQAVDTVVVYMLAFGGLLRWGMIGRLVLSGYILKVAYEAAATPITYAAVGALKRSEGLDAFDVDENFAPFVFRSDTGHEDAAQSP